jgi:hypothetical protein
MRRGIWRVWGEASGPPFPPIPPWPMPKKWAAASLLIPLICAAKKNASILWVGYLGEETLKR